MALILKNSSGRNGAPDVSGVKKQEAFDFLQLPEWRRRDSVEGKTCLCFRLKMIAPPLSDGMNVMAEQELRPFPPQRFVTLATLISENDVCFYFW